MENRYTGVFVQVRDWWFGHVEEPPGCNVQERTLGEARESLKEAIQLIVQANRELARRESEGQIAVGEKVTLGPRVTVVEGRGVNDALTVGGMDGWVTVGKGAEGIYRS